MNQNQTALEKLLELVDKETPEQRKAFLAAEHRYMAEQERIADRKMSDSYADWAVTMYIAGRYMK